MAESSFIWDTNATGDGSAHSEGDSAALFAAILGQTSGVLHSVLNELAPTVSGTSVLVNTGWAIVDGHPYRNSASLATVITTPSIGTTGHRLVLRANWAAQTVRVFDIASADGTATIPAATQTSGTTYDATIATLTITTGGTITLTDAREYSIAPGEDVFDGIRTLFRATTPRKLLGLYTGQTLSSADGAGAYLAFPAGVGFYYSNAGNSAAATGNLTASSLEGYSNVMTGAATTVVLGSTSTSATIVGCTAPNKNPRMLVRWRPGSSTANLATTMVGFTAAGVPTATIDGAYLRANTTGNLFAVTRQTGSETTTDLGARPTVPTSYEVYTDDAGVTWLFRNTTTGAVVATHTANIPTVTVALGFGFTGISSSGNNVAFGPVYCEVWSNNVA